MTRRRRGDDQSSEDRQDRQPHNRPFALFSADHTAYRRRRLSANEGDGRCQRRVMAESIYSPGMHFSSSPCIRTASIARSRATVALFGVFKTAHASAILASVEKT